MNVGLVGCGSASRLYLEGCKQFDSMRIEACADVVTDRARAIAAEFNVGRVCEVVDLFADPLVDIVLNLTDPQAHARIGLAAIESGKHVYQEKPIAIELDEARMMLDAAAKKSLRVGCAPDTFLGGGLQTCRDLIDEGAIGEPVACAAFMLCHGHEDWHPNPELFYQYGGGPMFDMGPYYLTALISLLGPIRSVSASAKITDGERIITSEPRYGQKIKVEVPTHVSGTIEFSNGVIGTVIMSFDVWASRLPSIEVYGTKGTLSVPDPNTFGGPVRLFPMHRQCWVEVPVTRKYSNQSRGLGLTDMIYAIDRNEPHRANGELAYHVLEVMKCFHHAAFEGKRVNLIGSCARPEPLPLELS